MYTLYGYGASGNCYKIKLLLHHLNIDYDYKEVDFVIGETRTEEYLKINPVGQIPALVISEKESLAESNAILFYLSEGTPYLPTNPYSKAKVLQWLFFEQYKHEPNIATVRFWKKILKRNESQEEWRSRIQEKTKNGYAALKIMDDHLSKNDFFVDNTYSIADIGLYAYTRKADEGEFDLSPYPNILKWFERVESQERFLPFN
ncbi:glutathione S-transferase domain-containing protein [Cunninghamella echinulata]|nr:glutathione S-transferase domain-containing protein [Cunninghamella echinulata]